MLGRRFPLHPVLTSSRCIAMRLEDNINKKTGRKCNIIVLQVGVWVSFSFWSEPRQLQQPRHKMTYYWAYIFSPNEIVADITFPFRASISKFQACTDWASKLLCEANTSFNKADTCMKRRVWPEGKIEARWAQSKECCHCINWAVVDSNRQSVSRQE